MKFKFLFCGMFVLIGSSQSTGLRVLGRAGAVALQTHVRYCTVKHGTEFKVPPGLKLGKISQVPVSRIDISQYSEDAGRLVRAYHRSELGEEKNQKYPLFKSSIPDFEKAEEFIELTQVRKAVGLVSATFDFGGGKEKNALGAGFAIRRDALLTAAHNITLHSGELDATHNMLAKTVEFYPGYDNGQFSVTLQVKDFKVPDEWLSKKDETYDFALLFLEGTDLAEVLRLSSIKDEMNLPIPVRVAGYPNTLSRSGQREKNDPLSLYLNSGYIKKISECRKIIGYDVFTDMGMSGGPIFVRELPIALGVHTKGGWDLNRGIHYADHMISYLDKWFAERDNTIQDVQVELEKLIAELAQSEEEKEHLLEKMDSIAAYPAEKWRAYLAFYLDLYRKK